MPTRYTWKTWQDFMYVACSSRYSYSGFDGCSTWLATTSVSFYFYSVDISNMQPPKLNCGCGNSVLIFYTACWFVVVKVGSHCAFTSPLKPFQTILCALYSTFIKCPQTVMYNFILVDNMLCYCSICYWCNTVKMAVESSIKLDLKQNPVQSYLLTILPSCA